MNHVHPRTPLPGHPDQARQYPARLRRGRTRRGRRQPAQTVPAAHALAAACPGPHHHHLKTARRRAARTATGNAARHRPARPAAAHDQDAHAATCPDGPQRLQENPPSTAGPALRGPVRGAGGCSDDALRVRFPRAPLPRAPPGQLRLAPAGRVPRALARQLRRGLLRRPVHHPAQSRTVRHHLPHPEHQHRRAILPSLPAQAGPASSAEPSARPLVLADQQALYPGRATSWSGCRAQAAGHARHAKGCAPQSCPPGCRTPSSCASTAGTNRPDSGSAAPAPAPCAGPGACAAPRDWTVTAAT
jgi:hypothetical protein